jgi:hypothetical protein
MTKAPLSNYEATLRVKMISGVCALVQQMAIKAVKEHLRRRGIRSSSSAIES